jgi:hypothetical protein
MILYSQEEFMQASFRDMLDLKCDCCEKTFKRKKLNLYVKSKTHNDINHFCSIECQRKYKQKGEYIKCGNCNKEIYIINSELKKSKSKKLFCSRICSASYNNRHKDYGIRRSKLELFLESQLTLHYPSLKYLPNDITAINYELDFYFPEIKFAIEINGIVHYEPIYGDTKFQRIQFNDKQKLLLCNQNNIELCILSNTFPRLTENIKKQVWANVSHILDTILTRK